MTTECYYSMCPKHGTHDGGEGPFCDEPECSASTAEIKLYAAGRRLELQGYNLEELEVDNPYTQWERE